MEFAFYAASGKMTYKLSACTKLQKATRMDDTPVNAAVSVYIGHK
jgi:hypothetical protein